MKTYHIKDLLKKELLILELPEGTADFIVMNTGDRLAVCAFDDVDFCLDVKGISTEYTLLGKPSEIKEEDAMDLVHKDAGEFADYKHDANWFPTATESLLSAIESVIFWENPFGESKYFHGEYTDNGRIAAELRTFDRNRTLIFVKN